jgi:hypothetical protein
MRKLDASPPSAGFNFPRRCAFPDRIGLRRGNHNRVARGEQLDEGMGNTLVSVDKTQRSGRALDRLC